MTSFVDHMKNITVPSMVQDINEMNHYWAVLTRMPGSGVSAQPNMDVVTTSNEEKLFPLDNGWYLRRETPVKGFTKKWPDPIHGPNALHIDGLEDMLELSKDANDTATKRKLHKKIDAAKTIGMLSDDNRLYYYAYVRQGKVNGEEVQPERREYWDPPMDVFELDAMERLFRKHLVPLLPKDTKKVIANEKQQEAMRELDKNIHETLEKQWNASLSEALQLKVWHDSCLDAPTQSRAPMFTPSSQTTKTLHSLLGIVQPEGVKTFASPQRVRQRVTVKTPPTVKRGVREQPSPMPYASLFKKEDLDKIQEQWEADRKAMGSTMPFDSVIGIHVNEFANVFDEKVAIFVHTIDYFIEVLDHFRDYLLQAHRHSVTNQRLYFIGNEIHITVQEYQYLRNYLNTLKNHTLPALKAKIQAAASQEHKRIKKKLEALDASVDSENMPMAHEFEPCGPRIHTRRNRTISTRAPPPEEQIHEEHRQQLVDRMPRDSSERPVVMVASDPSFQYVIKVTGTLVLPLLIRHLTMNMFFRRFNPILQGDHNVGIYPSTLLFEQLIVQFCMKTSYMTSNLCLRYFHPDNFMDTATFKQIMEQSMPSMFTERIRALSFSYLNATGTSGTDPQSKQTMHQLYTKFKESMEATDTGQVHLWWADAYEEACMELLNTGIINELKVKSAEAYKKLNTPRNELVGVSYDNGQSVQETLMQYALDAQTYHTLLIMTEETIRMWAYKMYWDWALIAQSILTTTMLPWKMNTNKQLITSVTGAITASQVEKLYSFSTSMVTVQQQNESVVDNSINFLVYGLESGILYFWLNLLNGYMRIGVITEDELVKGKTYLYNHEMPRSFDGIRQMMWAQQKNRQHVPLCQLKYDDESRALFVDTKNPMLYVQEGGYNNTPIDMGRIASNRLRACLYPQGSVVRFRSHHIWQYGIVVDDLGGIWKDKTPLKHEEEMLGIEHGRHRRIMQGNARTILYLRRKRQVTGETPFELATSIVNVSEEYMGEQYRFMIHLQILVGIYSLMFVHADEGSRLVPLIAQVLAGSIFDSISFVALLIPAIAAGAIFSNHNLVMLQSAMLGTYLMEYSTKSIQEIVDGGVDKVGERLCILVELEIDIQYNEHHRNHYIDHAVFWVPTTATMCIIDSQYGGSIQYAFGAEHLFVFQAKPLIQRNDSEVVILLRGLGNLEMRFKRPLHSNTDASWFTGNASPDVVYHPWYYNLFIEGGR